jgi:hypothetical protein
MLLICIISVNGQDSLKTPPPSHNNILKINLLPIFPAINGHNQKWIGLEYDYLISNKLSFSMMADVGLFEDYTFIKYHNFFEENGTFSNTRQEVRTWGYHLIPSASYHFLEIGKMRGRGFYLGGNLDFNQYFRKSETTESISMERSEYSYHTSRFSIGATLGVQYIAWSRLVIDLNISLFVKLFTINSEGTINEIDPLHATWVFYNGDAWSTVNLMIGYSFGGVKKKNEKK